MMGSKIFQFSKLKRRNGKKNILKKQETFQKEKKVRKLYTRERNKGLKKKNSDRIEWNSRRRTNPTLI